MDAVSISVQGSDAILNRMDALNVALQEDIQALLEEAGQRGEKDAIERCPVSNKNEPGHVHMKDQMYVEVEQGQVILGNRASYAPPVELGHHTRSGSWVAPQPFLGPAGLAAGSWLREEASGLVAISVQRIR